MLYSRLTRTCQIFGWEVVYRLDKSRWDKNGVRHQSKSYQTIISDWMMGNNREFIILDGNNYCFDRSSNCCCCVELLFTVAQVECCLFPTDAELSNKTGSGRSCLLSFVPTGNDTFLHYLHPPPPPTHTHKNKHTHTCAKHLTQILFYI